MNKYKKVSLESLNKLLEILKYESYLAAEFSNKTLLKELEHDGAIVVIKTFPKIIKLSNKALLFRYIKKSNALLAKNKEEFKEYLDFELANEIKSKDEVAAHKETTKDDISESFYGIHIAVTKETEVFQGNKKITLKPMLSGSYFFFQKNMVTIPSDTTVVGIENPQVLWLITRYEYLFNIEKVVFVLVNDYKCAYIYETWLSTIKGRYIHFGDFDLAGLSIYYDKVLPKLQNKNLVEFYLPDFIFPLLTEKGNKGDFDRQSGYLNGLLEISTGKELELVKHIKDVEKSLEQEKLSSFCR